MTTQTQAGVLEEELIAFQDLLEPNQRLAIESKNIRLEQRWPQRTPQAPAFQAAWLGPQHKPPDEVVAIGPQAVAAILEEQHTKGKVDRDND